MAWSGTVRLTWKLQLGGGRDSWRGGWGGAQSRRASQAKPPEMWGGLAGPDLGAAGWSAAVEGEDCFPPGLVYHLSLVRMPWIFFLRGYLRSEKDSNILTIRSVFWISGSLATLLPMRKCRPQAWRSLVTWNRENLKGGVRKGNQWDFTLLELSCFDSNFYSHDTCVNFRTKSFYTVRREKQWPLSLAWSLLPEETTFNCFNNFFWYLSSSKNMSYMCVCVCVCVCTVDPWTTWVWTSWVHLYVDF